MKKKEESVRCEITEVFSLFSHGSCSAERGMVDAALYVFIIILSH